MTNFTLLNSAKIGEKNQKKISKILLFSPPKEQAFINTTCKTQNVNPGTSRLVISDLGDMAIHTENVRDSLRSGVPHRVSQLN